MVKTIKEMQNKALALQGDYMEAYKDMCDVIELFLLKTELVGEWTEVYGAGETYEGAFEESRFMKQFFATQGIVPEYDWKFEPNQEFGEGWDRNSRESIARMKELLTNINGR